MPSTQSRIARPAACSPWVAISALVCLPVDAQENPVRPSLSLSAGYTGDLRRNTTGGLAVGDAYADSIDLGLVWVNDGLLGGTRMTANLSMMYLHGDDITGRLVGDLQGVNNLEAQDGWKLYESWVEFGFGDGASTLRTGVLDINAEFDVPETSALFLNSSFGIGPDLSQTGVRGPGCWPNTGLGMRLAGEWRGGLAWRVAAYDATPGTDDDDFTSVHVSRGDGALIAGELEYRSERIHKLAFGAWQYSASFEPLLAVPSTPQEHRGNRGFYAMIDASLGSVGRVDFDGALRAGTASDKFNAVDLYTGAVITATHLWESRPGDALGLGVARVRLGDSYRALRNSEGQPATAAETTFELVYRAELTPWLSLLPNVQFVDSPGADPGTGDSWVAGLRFEIAYEKSWALMARAQRKSPSFALGQ